MESQPLSELNKIPNSTLGEAIANIPGVYQTGIGTGISKPIIRGLSGSSVVTYVNSLRIQNQQWGSDHGLPVTSLGIGGVEVIKGPASLLFGADALGGVLYFVDEPYAERNTISGYTRTRFEHNSLGTSNDAGFRYSGSTVRFNLFGSYDNFADFGIPNGNQILNTRFNQSSAKLAFGINKKRWILNIRYNFYDGHIGLPGIEEDTIVDPSFFQTNLQQRSNLLSNQHIQNHFLAVENKFFFKNQEIFITVGNTNNSLKEYEESLGTPSMFLNLNNSIYNVKWRIRVSKEWETIIGSQGMYQVSLNGAEEILIPDSKTGDLGTYGLLRYHNKNWRILLGGRFDHRAINTFNQDNFKGAYNSINYSGGFAYLGKRSTIRFNVSSGFRAPNSSELLSDGSHPGSFRYEIGDESLQTEKATQLDASYALHYDDLELIINPFFNYIRDYTYLQQQDSVINNLQVYQYTQAKYAMLYGLDFGLHYHPHHAHWIHLESSFSNVFAEDEHKSPIPRIPQSRINTQIKFEFNMKGKFKLNNVVLQHLYFFKQNRLGALETSSPAYQIVNLGLNMKIDSKQPLYISVGARNLLNTTYIDHLSGLKNYGLPGPGINAYISVRLEFRKSLLKKK